ncbi:MAG: divalent metal cation transporter [Bacteroidia bacterium]|nr:divalent metal cation transporter [Bacteroidia bacterium]
MENEKYFSRWSSIFFWFIISAAFIGPGTVTTASSAGAKFGTGLLWALILSTIGTIILQEAAARLTIVSGQNLGQVIASRFRSGSIPWLVTGAIIFGCVAFQAGNIIGAISGIQLITDWPVWIMVFVVGIVAFLILWSGSMNRITAALGIIVAGMGLLFVWVAISALSGVTTWSGPIGVNNESLVTILGLIGTTIVPYNLFLASGISKGQSLKEMRFGIIGAVAIGGLISCAILLAGTSVEGEFSFMNLANAISEKSGSWAAIFFGFGLFAAGLSSSITAPLAAAITAQSVFGKEGDSINRFRYVWIGVLVVGVFLGLLDIKPIPAIIAAQAINGCLLPIVVCLLFLAVNDRKLLGNEINSLSLNILSFLIVILTVFLGLNGLWSAMNKVIPQIMSFSTKYTFIFVLETIIIIAMIFHWRRQSLQKHQ